jgi:YidC/Oxa1 family membrane protein insertase
MNHLRFFLLAGLFLVGLQLWVAWEKDYGQRPVEVPLSTAPSAPAAAGDDGVPTPAAAPSAPADVPTAPAEPAATPSVPAASQPTAEAGRLVRIESDVLRLTVSTRGAEILEAELPGYPVSLDRRDVAVKLLNQDAQRYFIAQSGLVASERKAPDHTTEFQIEGDAFVLAEGQAALEVPFTWSDGEGLTVRKILRLERGSYALSIRHEIDNQSAAPWRGSQYRQMQRVPPPKPSAFAFNDPELYAFVGAAVYSPDEMFQKLPFQDFEEEPYRRTFAGGWSAMQQHYFVGAYIPDPAEQTSYETAILPGSGFMPTRFLMRQMSPALEVAPGASQTISARLYLGPKLQSLLPEVAPGLQYTVDYGMVSFIAQPLFWLMSWIHKLVGNWGVAIIILTLLIKLAFYRLSEAQYRSMARMRKLQPRLEALKERFGDDRQKMAQAQMDLFKQEKVNPLGGCLPILVQIPVFFALYWVIFEAVELRQAPFFGWIQDLSVKDPYFVLPLLNAVVMWYTQRLSPTPGMDPVQRKVLQSMPLVFGVLFAFFPSGLVLYWLANGVLGLVQQIVIMKRVEAEK